MVLLDLHLVALKSGISIGAFLTRLQQHGIQPVIQARVVRWMIRPTQLSADFLLNRNTHWDVLLGLEASASQPSPLSSTPELQAMTEATWRVTCGVSSRTLSGYAALNAELQRQREPRPRLPAGSQSADAQNLEFSRELAAWIRGGGGPGLADDPLRDRPISMLNLLAFRSDDGSAEAKRRSHAQYVEYGKAFSASAGARHGGRVKIAARVVPPTPASAPAPAGSGDGDEDGDRARWDEIAFVHYPSVRHFVAMASSEDYQAANRKHRLGALQDTFILCVAEIDARGELLTMSKNENNSRPVVGERGKL